MPNAPSTSSRKAPLAGLMLVTLVGFYLRLCGLSTQQIFADEIHGLYEAASHGYTHIFTHFTVYDACIPLTLYNKFIMDCVGINELLFHLPSMVSGCATLLLVAWISCKWFGPATALMATGLLALSPYHIYLSREARPYPIAIFFLTLAVDRVLTWAETGTSRPLIIAALASFGALYFHLISLPAIGLLLAFAVERVSLRLRGEDKRSLRNSVLLFGVLAAAFFLPALPSLVTSLHGKAAQGRPGLATVQYGLYLTLALHKYAFIPEVSLAGWGVRAMMKVRKEEALLLTALLLFQSAFIGLSSPRYAEIPWVWMRYMSVLLPVWFLLVAVGIEDLARRIPLNSAPLVVASILLMAIGLYDGIDGFYPLGRNRNFNVHPMVMAHELGRATVLPSLLSSAFYQRLRDSGEDGAILELPFVTVFPIYDLYQRVHRCPVYVGGIGRGIWQELFNREGEFRFRRMVDLRDDAALAALPVKYVVIHKHMGSEMADVRHRLMAIETTRRLLMGFGWMFRPDKAQELFGDERVLRDWGASRFGPPVYEDAAVVVYDMASLRSQARSVKPNPPQLVTACHPGSRVASFAGTLSYSWVFCPFCSRASKW